MSKNREKFVELAEKRVQKTIKSMRLIGNLSNKTNYSYDDADLKKIFTTLRREMDQVRKKFDTSSSEPSSFIKQSSPSKTTFRSWIFSISFSTLLNVLNCFP